MMNKKERELFENLAKQSKVIAELLEIQMDLIIDTNKDIDTLWRYAHRH